MPTRKVESMACEAVVRSLLRASNKRVHNKCNKCKKPHFISGEILNIYFEVNDLNNEIGYRVCSNFADALKTVVRPSVVPHDEERRCRKVPRLKQSEALLSDISSSKLKYYKAYGMLKSRERDRRQRAFAIELIASCVNKNELNKKGLAYVQKNNDLAVMINTVIDGVCDTLS